MWSERKPSLLLVEDNLSTQTALARLFRMQFQVTSTASPIEALEILKKGLDPVIIFSDYIMPEMTGLQFLLDARSLAPAAVRIILTGHLATEELTAAMNENILHRVLMKPWENDLLLFQMQEALKVHEILKEKLRLERLSVTDSLTGLFNQRHFQETLKNEIERASRYGHKLSLVLIDVDSFKSTNDTQGHIQGDHVLKAVAQVLKKNVRNVDIVCRYGGDEFAILLPETTLSRARDVAERIRLDCVQQTSNITLSLGVADLNSQRAEPRLLIEAADKALYQAKRNGKNQTAIADN